MQFDARNFACYDIRYRSSRLPGSPYNQFTREELLHATDRHTPATITNTTHQWWRHSSSSKGNKHTLRDGTTVVSIRNDLQSTAVFRYLLPFCSDSPAALTACCCCCPCETDSLVHWVLDGWKIVDVNKNVAQFYFGKIQKITSSLVFYARKHESWCDRHGRNLYLSKNKQYGTETLGHLLDAAG